MQPASKRSIDPRTVREPRRCYRVDRQYSSQRKLKDLVRDLFRAHGSA